MSIEVNVFPAYAGMILEDDAGLSKFVGVPRIRGDDPIPVMSALSYV